jgi:hypothetical protein
MINSESYLRVYFGPRSEYYLKKYKAFHSGKKFSFNISAFFAGLFWFLYRKLYVQAVLLLLLSYILRYLVTLFYNVVVVDVEIQRLINLLLTATFGVICGFLGNYLYVKKSERQIKNALSKTENEDERIQLLKAAGGIAWTPIVLLLIATFLFTLVVTDGFKDF